ncbi:solute carrier family 23 member 1 [Plakobranchus ocellatus]|uniref:Solute carrier family 23 member 1 n=1 Tax=Plakobranchus ocellatus TaxID=259542 RepID=A0AAV4E062_9GAST|nr:solute carrier family 23 member 1 [Plakobranchus ocellatus]
MVSNYNTITPEGPAEPRRKSGVIYSVEDKPTWYLCLVLALQQFLITFQSTFSFPIIIKEALCIDGDDVGVADLISTTGFVAGLSTLLQSTLGVRLPVIQAISGSFVTPVYVILRVQESNCPFNNPDLFSNATLPERGSDEHREIWQRNVQEIQGSLMVASLLSVVIGFSGVIGIIIKYIGPLTIAPTLVLISLSLMKIASDKSSTQWYICFMTLFLMVVFSQYLREVAVPIPGLQENVKIFELFSLLLAMVVAWLICLILTAAGVFPDDPTHWSYRARTDSETSVLRDAKWLHIPYPGQFGLPRVTLAGTLGLFAAVLASCIESMGNYYATARLCNAPTPPSSALSRGIFVEGVTGLLSGAWGSCGGTSTYSQNVATISITKVGCRIVSQAAGITLMIFGCFGKFGALFSTIPDPIIGAMFYITFGMIGGVGVSNLQYVDLKSSRNIFIFGVSLLFGLSLPRWVEQNRSSINTGSSDADNVIAVLGGTSMFIGGVVAFFLDNTIPGTPEERGLSSWTQSDDSGQKDVSLYDIPLIQPWLNGISFLKYLPVCPRSFMDQRPSRSEASLDPERNGSVGPAEKLEESVPLSGI